MQKTKFKFSFWFLIFLCINLAYSKELIIRNQNKDVFAAITDEGDFISNVPVIEEPSLPGGFTEGLVFRFQGDSRLAFTSTNVRVKEALYVDFKNAFPIGLSFNYYSRFNDKRNLLKIGEIEVGVFIPGKNYSISNSITAHNEDINYVETIVYKDIAKKLPSISRTFSNGNGYNIQNQIFISPIKVIASGIYYNIANAITKETLPAPMYSGGAFIQMRNNDAVDSDGSSSDKLLANVNEYYDKEYGEDKDIKEEMYPYSETIYEDDPLSRVKEVGAPGDDYRIKSTNSHTVKTWNFGVATATSFIEGVITPSKEETILGSKGHDTNAKYYLTIIRDPNDIYSQVIKDMSGNVVAKASHDDKGQLVKSTYEYDILGREIRKNPPSEDVPSDTTGYNALGQVTETWSPDKGLTTFAYNNDGSLKEVSKANGTVVKYDYDALGRVTRIYTDAGTHVRNYYHRTKYYQKDLDDGVFGTNADPNIETILGELTNIRGRLFLEVAHNELGDVIDVYSYDDEGRTSASYTKIPGMAWVKTSYKYRFQGEVEEKTIIPQYLPAGTVKPIVTRYKYNKYNNALDTVKIVDNSGATEVERKLAVFEYDQMGKLVKKYLYDGKTDLLVATKAYEDNMRGWTTKIINKDEVGNKVAFQEDVFYNGMYDGTITSATYKYQPDDAMGKDYPLDYIYDRLKRLTAVKYSGTDAATFTDYNEAFAYDKNGRITQKVKGSLTLNTTPGFSDYNYKVMNTGEFPADGITGTRRNNQLTSVSSKHTPDNYLYDENGNMIADTTKELDITYDWRDMPTTMILRDGQGATDDEGFTVRHVYNAKGNRVLKTSTSFTKNEGTAYAGNGLVFRNNNLSNTLSKYNVLYANLGEVRFNYYEENVITKEKDPINSYGEAFFTLQDHLGSARAVLASDGDVINQDWYYAYGEIENITNSGEIDEVTKVREQFTGKEFDEDGALVDDGLRGIDLFYFGARFYDADVGVWINVDPVLEFWSAYAYSNNPINNLDPNGARSMGVISSSYQQSSGNFHMFQYFNNKHKNENDRMVAINHYLNADLKVKGTLFATVSVAYGGGLGVLKFGPPLMAMVSSAIAAGSQYFEGFRNVSVNALSHRYTDPQMWVGVISRTSNSYKYLNLGARAGGRFSSGVHYSRALYGRFQALADNSYNAILGLVEGTIPDNPVSITTAFLQSIWNEIKQFPLSVKQNNESIELDGITY